MSAAEMHDVFAEWNKGVLDSYLIEITRDIFGFQGEGRHAARGSYSRCRRAKGNRQMDGHRLDGAWHPDHADRRGRLWACVSALKRGTCRRGQSSDGSIRETQRCRYQGIYRCHPRCTVCIQDHQLCSRIYVDAGSGQTLWVEPELRRHCVMWRGGCIIRSRFLGKIKEAFDRDISR